MKIAILLGTRPEAVKLAPVVLASRRRPDFDVQVCVTGQHREMLDQALMAFDVQPDTDLRLMHPGEDLASFMGRALQAISQYLGDCRPDAVVVQGDTSTVLAAALAAFYRSIPVAHVEAGLRSHDLGAPWPEEANRVLVSRIASLHFAPTEASRRNLLAEGVAAARILVTGNTVVDALQGIRARLAVQGAKAPSAGGHEARYVLVTGHRRESFGEGLANICNALLQLARRFADVRFIYPVHMNPSVRSTVEAVLRGAGGTPANLELVEPLAYVDFVALMAGACLILTDSGGIQEEAPSLGVPVLVMREKTERPEAVEAGVARLVGTRVESIVRDASWLLSDEQARVAMLNIPNPFGDGHAAERIVNGLRLLMDAAPAGRAGTE